MARRVVLDARAALFENHVALGQDFLFVETQIDHAVGFHLHHRLQAVLGDALEVAGRIVAGEGVVLAAEPADDLGEFADGDLLRRLEHQVFEEVGDAGNAAHLVRRPDPVPDHVGDDRGAVIGDDDDLHAVGELELAGAGLRGLGGEGVGSNCEHGEGQEQGCKERSGTRMSDHAGPCLEGSAAAR